MTMGVAGAKTVAVEVGAANVAVLRGAVDWIIGGAALRTVASQSMRGNLALCASTAALHPAKSHLSGVGPSSIAVLGRFVLSGVGLSVSTGVVAGGVVPTCCVCMMYCI